MRRLSDVYGLFTERKLRVLLTFYFILFSLDHNAMLDQVFSPFAFEDAVLDWIVRKLPADFRQLYKSNSDIRQLILMYFKVCETSIFMILLALSPLAPPYFLEHAHPLPILAFLVCIIMAALALAFTLSTHIANAIVVVGSMICVLGYSLAFGGVYSQMSRHGQTVFFLNVTYGMYLRSIFWNYNGIKLDLKQEIGAWRLESFII